MNIKRDYDSYISWEYSPNYSTAPIGVVMSQWHTPKNDIYPCRYCNEDTHLDIVQDGHEYCVCCDRCGSRGPLARTQEGAIRYWNKVTYDD